MSDSEGPKLLCETLALSLAEGGHCHHSGIDTRRG